MATGGRPTGNMQVTQYRIQLIAASLKLGQSLNKMSSLVYPDTPLTAYVNTRKLKKLYQAEIEKTLRSIVTPVEAEAIIATIRPKLENSTVKKTP
jgi:hypothetical protein